MSALRFSLWRLVVAALAFLVRAPVLAHAREIDADAAVVGIQAIHVAHGETPGPWLYGTDYQGSVDAVLAALAMRLSGAPAPRALVVVETIGFAVQALLVHDMVGRRIGPGRAVLATVPLLTTLVPLVAPRHWAFTAALLAVWLLDRAATAAGGDAWRRAGRLVAAGVLALGLAAWFDTFTVALLPASALALVAVALPLARLERGARRAALAAVAPLALPAAVVATLLRPLLALASPPGPAPSRFDPSLARAAANLRLLVETCLPRTLAMRSWSRGAYQEWTEWTTVPGWLVLLRPIAAALLVGVLFAAGARGLGALARALRGRPRGGDVAWWLALAPLGVAGACVTGFCVSSYAADLHAHRFLLPIVWAAPLAFVAWPGGRGARWAACAVAPFAVTSAIAAWVDLGAWVRRGPGDLPVAPSAPTQAARDDDALLAFFREQGIVRAQADYWVAYRLTLLAGDAVHVVPLDPAQERYAYAPEVWARPGDGPLGQTTALVFQAARPPHVPEAMGARALQAAGVPFDVARIGSYVVLVPRDG